jgi:hypothetical protein
MTMTALIRFYRSLFAPIDITPLVYFRVCFGAFMVYHAVRYTFPDSTSGKTWVDYLYSWPVLHFPYDGFHWLKPWSGDGITSLFWGLGILAFCLTVGLFFRISAFLFALGYWYVFLLDAAYYQNHYYLVGLIALLMPFLPANRALSIDAWMRPQIRSLTVDAWSLWLLRFQIGIVYFYGGVAKLDSDWLRGEPVRTILNESPFPPSIAPFFQNELMTHFVAGSGLALDLLAAPLLLWRRTRVFMFLALVVFHLSNAWLFSIGIFPWLMLVATAILFLPRLPKIGALRSLPSGSSADLVMAPAERSVGRRLVASLLAAYVTVQLLVPLRHFLYPGNAGWTDEANNFAWRMMLYTKRCQSSSFDATDNVTGAKFTIDPHSYLNPVQVMRMLVSPHLIHQFCRGVAADLRQRKGMHVSIRVIVISEYNSRPAQLLVDPTVDLAREPMRVFRPEPWIMPLGEPLDAQMQRLIARKSTRPDRQQ